MGEQPHALYGYTVIPLPLHVLHLGCSLACVFPNQSPIPHTYLYAGAKFGFGILNLGLAGLLLGGMLRGAVFGSGRVARALLEF